MSTENAVEHPSTEEHKDNTDPNAEGEPQEVVEEPKPINPFSYVPVMENLTDKDSKNVYGIIVNLADYNVGADKGGAVNMFDDFDIDYNQQKYLIETRCSGALIKPFSAIVLRSGSETKSEEPGLPAAKAEIEK